MTWFARQCCYGCSLTACSWRMAWIAASRSICAGFTKDGQGRGPHGIDQVRQALDDPTTQLAALRRGLSREIVLGFDAFEVLRQLAEIDADVAAVFRPDASSVSKIPAEPCSPDSWGRSSTTVKQSSSTCASCTVSEVFRALTRRAGMPILAGEAAVVQGDPFSEGEYPVSLRNSDRSEIARWGSGRTLRAPAVVRRRRVRCCG